MNATKNPTLVYLRVSTAEQETDSQQHQVMEYCRVRGWQSPLLFRDAASGAASSRPGLESMLAQVRAGGVHQVVTYKLDRLGRSLTHLAIIVGELQIRKCRPDLHESGNRYVQAEPSRPTPTRGAHGCCRVRKGADQGTDIGRIGGCTKTRQEARPAATGSQNCWTYSRNGSAPRSPCARDCARNSRVTKFGLPRSRETRLGSTSTHS